MDISEAARALFRELDVRNLMLVPINDHAGSLKGTMAAVNVSQKSTSMEVMECVLYDFFMAITNIESTSIIRRMGTMDYLTNIKNRNSYEAELESFATVMCDHLWCVFIDVNGLHEMNNTSGHKAGDLMLVTVADSVRKMFGAQHTYRVGGDEFVAFAMDITEEEILHKTSRIMRELAAKQYFVSIGYAQAQRVRNTFDIDQVTGDAESAMYRDKERYYEQNRIQHERQRRIQMETV